MATRAYTRRDSTTARCFCDRCWQSEDTVKYEHITALPQPAEEVCCETCGADLDEGGYPKSDEG